MAVNISVVELSEEQQAELNRLYWDTDTKVAAITKRYGRRVKWHRLQDYVVPIRAEAACDRCSSEDLIWTSRTARAKEQARCQECEHVNASTDCRCEPCKTGREAVRLEQERFEQRRREAVQQQRRAEEANDAAAFEAWQREYGTAEYVAWALRTLTDHQRIFLHGLWHRLDEDDPFEIAAGIGTREHLVDGYLAKFAGAQLLYQMPAGDLRLNSAIGELPSILGPLDPCA